MFSFFHNWQVHLLGLIVLLLQTGGHGGGDLAHRPIVPDLPSVAPVTITQSGGPPPVTPSSPAADSVPLPDQPQPIEQPIDRRPPPDRCGVCGAPGPTVRKGPVPYCPMIVCYD